jgi:hypothetical protein
MWKNGYNIRLIMKGKIQTTGIGSLPHLKKTDAIEFSFKHDIPFLPQLTSLGENMIEQALSPLDPRQSHLALDSFLEKAHTLNSTSLKIQIAGPNTCQTSENPILKTIFKFVKILDENKLKPIIFIDEPCTMSDSVALQNIFDEINNAGFQSGLHSCNHFSLSTIKKFKINFLSYDSNIMNIKNSEFLKTHIVGVDPILNRPDEINQVLASYHDDIILSYSCGLAKYTEDQCEQILNGLNQHK